MGQIDGTYSQAEVQKQPVILFGNLKLVILGKLTLRVNKVFTITIPKAILLEKKLLNAFGEFVTEATGDGNVLNGYIGLVINGGLFMDTDKMFTIPTKDADILVKKLLTVLDEFVSEA